MSTPIIIQQQFRGPPASGNGGYVSGVFTNQLDLAGSVPGLSPAVEVTLRAPTPLDHPMYFAPIDSARANIAQPDTVQGEVRDGDTVIAQMASTTLDLSVPTPPSFAEALACQKDSLSLSDSIVNTEVAGLGFHPICFCCGADVPVNKGLRVFAAAVPGFDGVAAAWRAPACFADEHGMLPEPIVWAALDCPGQFAYRVAGIQTGLLGRMTGRIIKQVSVHDEITVIGWCIAVEGKKHFAGTALFDQAGECCAISKQVWIGRRN